MSLMDIKDEAENKMTQVSVLKDVKDELDEFCEKHPHLKKPYVASFAIKHLISIDPDDLSAQIDKMLVRQ